MTDQEKEMADVEIRALAEARVFKMRGSEDAPGYARCVRAEEAQIRADLCAAPLITPETVEKLRAALEPFRQLGRPAQPFLPAFHDLEDDDVVFSNSGVHISAGDVRALQMAMRLLPSSASAQTSELAMLRDSGMEPS